MATNLIFLQEFETDGQVSNFDLQNMFDKGFNIYEIYLRILSSSADGYIGVQFYDSSNTLIDGNEYDLGALDFKSNTSFDRSWTYVNTNQIAPIITGGNSSYGGGALTRIYNADDSASYTFVTNQSSQSNPSNFRGTRTIGVHRVAEKISGVRFKLQSQTNQMVASVFGVL
tara:strand:- start:531 stop:1043 length:513 start_codon:yes stop_codon:yes gene_type:complete